MPQASNPIALQGASNFRDLGGYTTQNGQRVKHGLVFRSDHLAKLTNADVSRLKSCLFPP